MAETKTYTEAEHDAILTSTVERETASLAARVVELEASITDTANKLDVAETEKAAALAAGTAATEAFEAFKTGLAELAAAESRTEERVSKVREVAKHLAEDFFTPERASRWAAMDDAAFTAYVDEITAASANAPAATDQPPTETAMQTGRQLPGAGPSRTSKLLGSRRGFVPTTASKGV